MGRLRTGMLWRYIARVQHIYCRVVSLAFLVPEHITSASQGHFFKVSVPIFFRRFNDNNKSSGARLIERVTVVIYMKIATEIHLFRNSCYQAENLASQCRSKLKCSSLEVMSNWFLRVRKFGSRSLFTLYIHAVAYRRSNINMVLEQRTMYFR